MFEYFIGGFVGAIVMYCWCTYRLHRSGWNWKLVDGASAQVWLHNKFMKEQSKPYKPNKNLEDR